MKGANDIMALTVGLKGRAEMCIRDSHIADDDPLFPQDAVDQRGLPHVRLADDRHLDDVVLFPLLRLRRKVLDAGRCV